MPVSWKKKIVYIHNQRTGGYSTTKALNLAGCEMDPLEDKHMTAIEMKPLIPDWDDYFKFMFVRNPFDRMVSLYLHRTQNLKSNRMLKYKSFSRYLKDHRSNPKDTPLQCEKYDKLDFVGRFETFEKDYKTVCKLAGIKNCLNHKLNSSKHTHYRDYYTTKSRRVVEKLFKKDLEKYNYAY